MFLHYPDNNISFVELHKVAKRTEEYKTALQLHKTFNHMLPEIEWQHLNWFQLTQIVKLHSGRGGKIIIELV
jgi:hypothetical protein